MLINIRILWNEGESAAPRSPSPQEAVKVSSSASVLTAQRERNFDIITYGLFVVVSNLGSTNPCINESQAKCDTCNRNWKVHLARAEQRFSLSVRVTSELTERYILQTGSPLANNPLVYEQRHRIDSDAKQRKCKKRE